jgi:hypothetical protein
VGSNPDHSRTNPGVKSLFPGFAKEIASGRVRRLLQPAALPRESKQPDPGRCLLRSCSYHPDTEGKHQAENHRATTPAASSVCSHNSNSDGPDPLLNLLLTCPKGSDDIHSGATRSSGACDFSRRILIDAAYFPNGVLRRAVKGGLESGGCAFSRGALYALLSNPIYVGEVRHKSICHPGQHQAILDRAVWERTQQQLRQHRAQRSGH